MTPAFRLAAKRLAKQVVIQSGLETVALSGAARFARSAAGRGVVFTLHHVRPRRRHVYEPNALLSVTPEFLEAAILKAKACGLVAVHLEDLPALLADPSDRRRFMCFTLDDGYRDNARFASPVFRRHGIPFTVFITPGFVERTRTMWWETIEHITRKADALTFDFGDGPEKLRCTTINEKFFAYERFLRFVETIDEDAAVARIDELARSFGIEPLQIVEQEIMTVPELRDLVADLFARLGAHTMTHPNLARVSAERVRDELTSSAAKIAAYVGRVPTTVAFPYGGRDAAGGRESAIARELGFSIAVTTQPGVLGSADPSALTYLPRVSLNGLYQKTRYVEALISGLPFKFLARRGGGGVIAAEPVAHGKALAGMRWAPGQHR